MPFFPEKFSVFVVPRVSYLHTTVSTASCGTSGKITSEVNKVDAQFGLPKEKYGNMKCVK